MEGWGKIGVQSASVLYPNSCYNESCYIEVQVYLLYIKTQDHEGTRHLLLEKAFLTLNLMTKEIVHLWQDNSYTKRLSNT